jgi:hypothetical protein
MKTPLRLLLLMAFSVMIFSCKKSNSSTSSYYFTGTYNGTAKTFNTTVTASKVNLGTGLYSLTIAGLSKTDESALELWSDQDNFVAGTTYVVQSSVAGSENSLSYVSPLGSSAPSSIWNTSYDFGSVNESFTCTITDATSTYVKGTFSGTIYMNTDSAVVTQTVTSGQFYAKFY